MNDLSTSEDVKKLLANTAIPTEVQSEYVAYHNNFSDGIAYHEAHIAEQSRILSLNETPTQDKKHILFRLAHTATMDARNAIDRYLRKADPALLPWTILAWQESHGRLVQAGLDDLLDGDLQAEQLVISGLGGDEHGRLRYCFALSTSSGTTLNPEHTTRIEEALAHLDHTHGACVECTEYGARHVCVTVLVPMDSAIGTYIEEVIVEANGLHPFLRFHYIVVNTHILTNAEIENYLAELKQHES